MAKFYRVFRPKGGGIGSYQTGRRNRVFFEVGMGDVRTTLLGFQFLGFLWTQRICTKIDGENLP